MTTSRNVFRSQAEFKQYMRVQHTRLVLDAVFAVFGMMLAGFIGLELAVALMG